MYRQILASFLLFGFLLTPVISAPNSKSFADDIGDVRIIGGDYKGYEDGDTLDKITTVDIATVFYTYDNVTGVLTIDFTFSSTPVINSSTYYAFELIFSSIEYSTEISITLRDDLHNFVIYTGQPDNLTRKEVNVTYTITQSTIRWTQQVDDIIPVQSVFDLTNDKYSVKINAEASLFLPDPSEDDNMFLHDMISVTYPLTNTTDETLSNFGIITTLMSIFVLCYSVNKYRYTE